jgi:MarR family transcriptional regulator, lower aerobic nicotinate degradation pathway regulator
MGIILPGYMGSHINGQGDSDDARHVLDAVRRIVRSLRVGSRAAEKAVGLSAAQLFILQRLAAGSPMSLNELAARTLTHQSSASVVVARLVERGLVQRSRSKKDARQLELSLTTKARQLLRRAPDLAQDQLIEAMQQMRAADVKDMARLLSMFVAKAGLSDEPAGMLFEEESKRGRSRPRKANVRTSR